MVSSTWGRREYRDDCVDNEFRHKREEKIQTYLRKPSTIRICEEVTTLPTFDCTFDCTTVMEAAKGGRVTGRPTP